MKSERWSPPKNLSVDESNLETIFKILRKGTTKSFQRPFMSSSQALLTKKADSFILGNIKLEGNFES